MTKKARPSAGELFSVPTSGGRVFPRALLITCCSQFHYGILEQKPGVKASAIFATTLLVAPLQMLQEPVSIHVEAIQEHRGLLLRSNQSQPCSTLGGL